MQLRLPRETPLLWRGPGVLQLGLGPSAIVVEGVTPELERALRALRGAGRPRATIVRELERAGVERLLADALVARLEPALAVERGRPLAVAVSGRGAEELGARLEREGLEVREWGERLPQAGPRRPALGLALELGGPVIRARRFAEAMAEDLPHAPIARSCGEVTIGPLVVPGESACLACLELAEREADPLAPVLAQQLAADPLEAAAAGPLEEPAAMELAVRLALAVCRDRDRSGAGIRLRLGRSPLPRLEPVPFHGACGCRALPGSGSGSAIRLDVPRIAWTRAAAGAARA